MSSLSAGYVSVCSNMSSWEMLPLEGDYIEINPEDVPSVKDLALEKTAQGLQKDVQVLWAAGVINVTVVSVSSVPLQVLISCVSVAVAPSVSAATQLLFKRLLSRE